MNDSELLLSHEKRLSDLENMVNRIATDVGKAEDKASSAWKRINEVDITVRQLNEKVEQLRVSMDERLDKLEQNVIRMSNDVKTMNHSTQYSLEQMKKAFVIVGLCAVVALVYGIVQDKVTADSLLNAVTSGAKILV